MLLLSSQLLRSEHLQVLAHVIPHEPNDTQSRRREAVSNDLAVLHDLPEFGLLTGEVSLSTSLHHPCNIHQSKVQLAVCGWMSNYSEARYDTMWRV